MLTTVDIPVLHWTFQYNCRLTSTTVDIPGIRYLPSIRSKSDLFTASIVPLLARIPCDSVVRRQILEEEIETSFPKSLSISRKKDFIQ